MQCHAVNTAIMQPCYLATSFIRGVQGAEFLQGVWPLRTASEQEILNVHNDITDTDYTGADSRTKAEGAPGLEMTSPM